MQKCDKISHSCKQQNKIHVTDGKNTVPDNAKTGKIKLGFGQVQTSDHTNSNLVWNLSKNGVVHFGNNNKIGTGSKIHVSGTLQLGNRVFFSGESCIISNLRITIGDNCLISWNTLSMDTDFHPIINENNLTLNNDKTITTGNSAWIGARATLLKGVSIGNNCIVSANSHFIKSYDNDTIIGGNPSRTIGSMKGKNL